MWNQTSYKDKKTHRCSNRSSSMRDGWWTKGFSAAPSISLGHISRCCEEKRGKMGLIVICYTFSNVTTEIMVKETGYTRRLNCIGASSSLYWSVLGGDSEGSALSSAGICIHVFDYIKSNGHGRHGYCPSSPQCLRSQLWEFIVHHEQLLPVQLDMSEREDDGKYRMH